MLHKVLIGTIAVVLASGLLLFGCHRWKHHHGMSKERIEWAQRHLATKLNLDEQQKTKLSEIAKRFSDKVPEMKDRRAKIAEAMTKSFETDKFDAAALNTEIDSMQKNFTEMRTMTVQAVTDFHAILTPEQRKKFVELIKKYQHHYGKAM